MQVTRGKKKVFILAAIAALAAPPLAQEWPKQRPVQFVVAFSPD